MMRIIILLLLAFFIYTAADAQKRTFMRIYSLQGKVMERGIFSKATDTSLFVIVKKNEVEVPVSGIKKIELGRSAAHSAMVGGLVMAPVISIAATADNSGHGNLNFPTDARTILGFISGALVGTTAGLLVHTIKGKTVFFINGSNLLWLEQKETIEKLPSGQK